MTKLVQRLQRTRDRVYSLSDKFGVVNHVDAVFLHRIHKSRFTVNPRPRLIEPTTRTLYKFNLSQTVEVNKDDKMLVGISRAGFENFDRIKSAPDGALPELNQYPLQVLAEPLVAGYNLSVARATDVSVSVQYPTEELGLSTYVSITDATTGRRVFYKSFKAVPFWSTRNVPLKTGNYFVATMYNRVLPVINDPVKADNYELDGVAIERSCDIRALGGQLSGVAAGGYTPMAVSWGQNQSYDFVYNGAVCYLNEQPYSIMWVDDNNSLDYEILVRPERRR